MQLLSLRGAAGKETRLADVHVELLQTAIPVRINTAQEAEWMSARELGSLAACTSGVCTCVFVVFLGGIISYRPQTDLCSVCASPVGCYHKMSITWIHDINAHGC